MSRDQEHFRWLDGDEDRDYTEWCHLWEGTRARRPHDHPGFLRMMRSAGHRPAAAVYAHPTGGRVMYPFYWRSLEDLPCSSDSGIPAIHLVSPYGYGGPLYEGPAENQAIVSKAFEDRFEAELRGRGAVSEFVREDLFEERLTIRTRGDRLEQQPNVVVRLDRHPDQVWREYLPKVRKNVNRARQQELRVVFDPCGEFLDQFLAVYHATMERTGAAASFFMDRERFELLGRTLGSAGGLTYVHVFAGEQIISTELLLLSSDAIYSFLGGTLPAYFDMRPNDLLKHEVIEWGGGRGFRHYVLGGGITAGDGIYIYKRAFDPSGVYHFFVRRIVHDPERYDRLVEEHIAYERKRGTDWKPRDGFFPAFLA
jgi:hypothetical protein